MTTSMEGLPVSLLAIGGAQLMSLYGCPGCGQSRPGWVEVVQASKKPQPCGGCTVWDWPSSGFSTVSLVMGVELTKAIYLVFESYVYRCTIVYTLLHNPTYDRSHTCIYWTLSRRSACCSLTLCLKDSTVRALLHMMYAIIIGWDRTYTVTVGK